jgi:hypothetical protein
LNADPELDEYICRYCEIEPPITYSKLKNAADARGLVLFSYNLKEGIRHVLDHDDPIFPYKTKTAAYREGLIRWIITNGKNNDTSRSNTGNYK